MLRRSNWPPGRSVQRNYTPTKSYVRFGSLALIVSYRPERKNAGCAAELDAAITAGIVWEARRAVPLLPPTPEKRRDDRDA